MPKPSSQRGQEEERDSWGFKEICLGKGKIKGIYREPDKEKLKKLTPQILPLRGHNYSPAKPNKCASTGPSLNQKFALETQSSSVPMGLRSTPKCTSQSPTLLINQDTRVYLFFSQEKHVDLPLQI